MIKQRPNAAFIFLLLIAFIVVKWMPAHVHLNLPHNHDGEHHQHSVEAHAHQQIIFHADPVDSDHPQMEDAKIVDLDHDQAPPNEQQADNQSAAIATSYFMPQRLQVRGVSPFENRDFQPRILYQRPGSTRAPPLLS
ncbi:MAG: hypothetical protein WC742_10255 [Gallionellaceae bacterium]|jgi:hypothetical protein